MIDELLESQRTLPAVEQFSRWHEESAGPAQAKFYRDLIPLTEPGRGQQYGFEVDLDKCSGCKACVSACHSLNGLDEGEVWRGVGQLINDDWRRPMQKIVTTACHHCVDPGCLNGCPVLAYDKDPVTGIVRHLDDQCIGCQYCVLKCPYDVPKYSAKRGIVRKCDMCSSRLAAQEAPACVQACPNEAIRITLVDIAETVRRHRGSERNDFLPGTPPPGLTVPTTVYKTKEIWPGEVRAVDREELVAELPHWALVWMLVLTQLGAGLYSSAVVLRVGGGRLAQWGLWQGTVAFFLALAGVGIGLLHLGRPLGAWRAFLGLRRSWLSREIVVFGGWLAGGGVYLGWEWFFVDVTGTVWGIWLGGGITAGLGLLGVWCSVMVYHDTGRVGWDWRVGGGRFLGTMVLLGAAGTMAGLLGIAGIGVEAVGLESWLWGGLLGVTSTTALFKLSIEQRAMTKLVLEDYSSAHKSALLLSGRFGEWQRLRLALLIAGGLVIPSLMGVQLSVRDGTGLAGLSLQAGLMFGFCLAGELIERWLFFRTVQPVKMPGSIAS